MLFSKSQAIDLAEINTNKIETIDSTRRHLLQGFALLGAAAMAPNLAQAMASSTGKSHRLSFSHTHTGEKLSVVYKVGDHYVAEGLTKLNRFLRDFRTGDVHPIDPKLFDQLWQIQTNTRSDAPFQIISGYRSPKTNNMLRGRSGGVAKKSFHMTGQALDIRLADVKLSNLRAAALELKEGGVGYYPSSNFVHIDTGRVRSWS